MLMMMMFFVKKSSLTFILYVHFRSQTFITFTRANFELRQYSNVYQSLFYSSDGCVYFCYRCRCTSPTGRMVQGGGAKGYTFSCGTQPGKRGKNRAKVIFFPPQLLCKRLANMYDDGECDWLCFPGGRGILFPLLSIKTFAGVCKLP